MDLEERLEKLRKAKGLTKQELYDSLEVSRSLVSAILSGDRALSTKVRRRIEDAEMQAGIAWSETELRESAPPSNVDQGVQHLADETLESMFKLLAEDLRKAEPERRTALVKLLDSVVGELQRRRDGTGGQFIPHEKKPGVSSGPPAAVGSTLAAVVKEVDAGGSEGSSPQSGVAAPDVPGRRRHHPSSRESKSVRPAREGGAKR